MGETQPTRQELENLWKTRVGDAKVRLDLASQYVKEVQRDLKAGAIPSADGRYAHHRALQAETLAIKHYRRVLNNFTALMLNGKIPDEQDTP
jgi:hypothetical protein